MNVAIQDKNKKNFSIELDKSLIEILLKDNSSEKNLLWATDNYQSLGDGYNATDFITITAVTGKNKDVIKPRIQKTKEEQTSRIRDKAEVFTPSWICNAQNNLIDNAWFETKNIFNFEKDKCWTTNYEKINFEKLNKYWQEYVLETRLEITCGEAPYLTSRYDMVSGEFIKVKDRIGMLDRKLRVINENLETQDLWLEWAIAATQNIYGYDWQGDNVFLARKNILATIIEHFEYKFNEKISLKILKEFAKIISWNIWQMDGLKFVIPNSCHKENLQMTLFDMEENTCECEGCRTNNKFAHNGIYCKIMNWNNEKTVQFVDLYKRGSIGK